MPRLALDLLGPFRARLNEKPLTAFATEKARALLVYLAGESPQPQRREALAGLLWPDQPEERARHNLRQALSSLRRTLGDNGDDPQPFVLVDRETVQFNPESDFSLDVAEFTRLAEAIRRHRHHSPERCLTCMQRFEHMAVLYRGDFLADLAVADSEVFEEWALLKREWLRRLASEAFAALADFHERREERAVAGDYVRRLVALEPWREEAHRQLMRLLMAEGKRSAALAQYEACRRLLETEFGAQPAAETRQLFERIKAEEHGVTGERTEYQRRLASLPRLSTSFVGREAERADLAEMLANPDCRLITLAGPGGIGKSRLALQVAQDHRGLFSDGVVFVGLGSATDRQTMALAIAEAFGVPAAPENPARRLLEFVRDKALLLVLDNFEHLLNCSGWLGEALHTARNITILVTSQEKLRLREEWLYSLAGLTYPMAPARKGVAPETYSALALFQKRAEQVGWPLTLDGAELAAAIRICQLVDGSPLGVELAAAAVGERTCSEIAAALEKSFDALESPLRNVPARHRSLRAVFDYAWTLLTPAEQQGFAALAVFDGSFDREAAVEVAGANSIMLGNLVSKSLLAYDGKRYLWHGMTRQYAMEKLTASSPVDRWRDRHCAFFAARLGASMALADSTRASAALAALEPDRANIKAAWRWAITRRHLTGLMDMHEGIGKFYRLRGPVQEGLSLLDEALVGLPLESAEALEASLRAEQVPLLCLDLRFDEGAESATRLSVLGKRLASPLLTGQGYLLKGQALQQQGRFEAAREALEAGLEHIAAIPETDVGANHLTADMLRELGNVATRRGEKGVAQARYGAALALYRQLADRQGESAVLNNLGTVAFDAGDYDTARAHLSAALALYRELGNLPGEAKALNNIANIAADRQDYGTALQRYSEALHIHATLENQRAQSAVLNNLAILHWELGLYPMAREAYQQALDLYETSGNQQAAGETLANLSLLELRAGNSQTALRLARQAIEASTQCGDALNLANACTYLGKIHAALGQLENAEQCYRRAVTIREQAPHSGRLLELQAEMAALTMQRGKSGQALEEMAPVLAALQQQGSVDGAEEPYRVYWICYQILEANADPRAPAVLTSAREQLLAHAARIPNVDLRRSFLENVAVHRQILEEA